MSKQLTQTGIMEIPDPVLLSPEERRVYRVLRVATTPRPCAGCGQPLSRVQASGFTLDKYPATAEPETFRCPHCGSGLWARPPVIASEAPFCWAKLSNGKVVPRGTLLT